MEYKMYYVKLQRNECILCNMYTEKGYYLIYYVVDYPKNVFFDQQTAAITLKCQQKKVLQAYANAQAQHTINK